ncbi:MAG TPA: hydroxyisourate hydrolase [Vicinamibacterales bacterium]|nr:hydroxyisourate hydrolase [Vicinamibacterales bacterium]
MITTHVLDTARGTPAAGVSVLLEHRSGSEWVTVGRAVTDTNGRVTAFTGAPLAPGTYRLTFDTAAYHRSIGVPPFFPEVAVVFEAVGAAHHHVPLLLSPYGYSTYRGA